MKNIVTIRIEDLKIKAIIGVRKEERDTPQDIILNIRVEYDAKDAIEKDNLTYALDYDALVKEISSSVQKSTFFLLEKLADMVLKIIMKNPLVIKSSVRIDKPNAIDMTKSVSLELTT